MNFEREEISEFASNLKIRLPKNLGDVIYSFRYRTGLPSSILEKAPAGETWIIRPAGRSKYRFALVSDRPFAPNRNYASTKIPDSTPGIIAKYAFSDEQAVLARVRYNRLIDIFLGIACYSRYGPGTWFTDQSRYMVYSFAHLWAPQGGAHMPWNETSAMDQRMHFIADYLEDYFPFSELCRRYGISRPTGYKWVQRYVDAGAAGLMSAVA